MENKPEPPPSPGHDSFGVKALGIIGVTAIIAGLVSFVVLPVVQGRQEGLDAFAALCRAIGLTAEPSSAAAAKTTGSTVVFDRETRLLIADGDAAKGAVLAEEVCTACHLANSLVSDPKTMPTITGQSARAIYKQLVDIKLGIRESEIMQPIVEDLDPAEMSDLAAYYAGLRRRNDTNPESPAISQSTIALVEQGDSTRAIPGCASCHDPRAGGPWEAPNLTGQYPPYTEAQLKAYAEGKRRNDVYARMRIIAGKLTAQEIRELSAYYNAPPYPHF